MTFHINVTDKADGRIDRYLAENLPNLTRSHIQKILDEGGVLVNQKPVKRSYVVKYKDSIDITVPDAREPDIEAEKMPLDIIYEDDDILVVNKPKGMVVHPAAGHDSGTLVNGLLEHCKGSLSGINGIMRPGIVHRIDKDTSGVLIVCKNDTAHTSIAAQLKEHSSKRRYYAIVNGVIKEDSGTVDAPIGRHPTERKKMCVNEKNGKRAVTHYKVIERFDKYTFIECELETGRTHQIRVHMAYIGHPLLGDKVYGPAKCPYPWLEGQALHAGMLGIVHPGTGEWMEFNAPLPDYFVKLLKNLK